MNEGMLSVEQRKSNSYGNNIESELNKTDWVAC